MRLRLATYNIHGAVGLDRRRDLDRTIAVLREIDADIYALQEVESRDRYTPVDQAEIMAESLNMHMAEGPSMLEGRGWYGNALLSRYPLEQVWSRHFARHSTEPRGRVSAHVRLDDLALLRVVGTHLDLRLRQRRRQFEILLDELDQLEVPAVLLGDFNEWWPWRAVWKMIRHHAKVPSVGATFPSWFPVFALDRIAFFGVEPVSIRRHRTPLTRSASDHLPVVAEIEVASARTRAPTLVEAVTEALKPHG